MHCVEIHKIFQKNERVERENTQKYRSQFKDGGKVKTNTKVFSSIFRALWHISNLTWKPSNSSIFQARIVVYMIPGTDLRHRNKQWFWFVVLCFAYSHILCSISMYFDTFAWQFVDELRWGCTFFCPATSVTNGYELLWLLSFYLQPKSDENKVFSTTITMSASAKAAASV